MAAIEAHCLSGLCIEVLQRKKLTVTLNYSGTCLEVHKITECRQPSAEKELEKHQAPMRTAQQSIPFSTLRSCFTSIYTFECLDVVVSALKDCFQQCDYSLYASLEQLLMKAC